MYKLKLSFEVNCLQYSKCRNIIEVKWCPPRQAYSNKNNWGYWTGKEKNLNKYVCDACLINMFRNDKMAYLEAITDSKKRRTLRLYIYGKTIHV